MYCSPDSTNITHTPKDIYFYDFNLPQEGCSNIYYNSSCTLKEGYRDCLYDNVAKPKLDNLARNRTDSLLEEESAYRPIAEVKPFFVYSTTEQAVASAEQRLYDAVSLLSRRRATLTPTSNTYSTPSVSNRNDMTSQPIMGTSKTIWSKPKNGHYNQPQVHRSVSINTGQNEASISRQNSTVGVTIGRRSFYPVYRGNNMNIPIMLTNKTSSFREPTDKFGQESKKYVSHIHADQFNKLYHGQPYLDSIQYNPEPTSYVHNSQSTYNAASRSKDKTNKVDCFEWTNQNYSSDNSLSFDEISSIPTTNSSSRIDCRSCNQKGIDCSSQIYSSNSSTFRKNSVSNSSIINKDNCIYGIKIKKPAPLPPYDSLYSVSNITYSSSSSSAYSSSSTPPELSELSVNIKEEDSHSPPPYMKVLYPSNNKSKINVAPPRPDYKKQQPKTIAAVSPSHVSTVSIPETFEYNERSTSAIPFDRKLSKNEEFVVLKKYSTLRPSKPPPPPPHQTMKSFSSTKEKNQLKEVKKDKKCEKAALKRAQSKLSFVDTFFQTDKSQVNIIESNTTQPNGVGIGITSLGAVSYNSIQHLEKKPKNMIKKSKKKDKKPKITKDDIGNPTNFQHRAHIGWNQNGGFNQNVCDEPMDDSVRALLTAAGENPDNMKPEEIKFAYQFIQNWENDPKSLITDLPTPPGAMVIERYPISSYEDLQKKPQISKPLPNLPASRVTQPNIPRHEMAPARPPPPPPPPGNRTASLATTSTPTHPPPPPPPPPPKFDSRMEQKLVTSAPPNAPPAPPPPPPTLKPESSKNAPPKPTGARANLLSEIHQGAKLRHVGAPVEKTGALVGKVANTSTGNARDDVMNAIRQGTSLRHVDQTEVEEQRKSVVENNMDGLAGALARALEKRRLNMNQSDSENADSGNEWDD